MSHRVGVAKPMFSWKMVAFVVTVTMGLLFAAVAVYKLPATGSKADEVYLICAGEKGVQLTASKLKDKLPLDDACWSGWVSLPDGFDFKVDNGKGNKLEVLLWDGKHRSTRGDGAGGVLWDGNIRTNSFRLRGEGGEAVITISPKASGPALKPAA